MRFVFFLALLFASAVPAAAQTPRRITPPTLKNRPAVMAERQRLANQILHKGDSVLVRVYAYVDEKGVTRMPEVRTSSGNAKADTAAMLLVRKMVWHPAQNTRRGVMLTIPVVFVRK